MDRYVVIGNPVEHSLSPLIHEQFAKQTKQPLCYEKCFAPEDSFADVLAAFKAGGGKGANVTVPFKEQAFKLMTDMSDRAKQAEAVNTIVMTEQGYYGDNTDGYGLVKDIRCNLHTAMEQKRILLIGAGGAAKGVLPLLLAESPALVHVVNRTVEKAEKLCARFLGAPVVASGFDALVTEKFDIVINASSSGLHGQLLPLPETIFMNGALSYDMIYGEKARSFLNWSAKHGAATVADGIGMLVEQAAESFYLWRQVRPNTQPILSESRKEI